jgi:cyclase
MSLTVLGTIVNSSLVTLKDGQVLVIDTGGTAEDGKLVYEKATALGPVAYVLNTHEHADHLGGNKFFDCPVIASAPARESIGKYNQDLYPLPTISFTERLTLYLGEPIELQLQGGHCPGVSTIYFPERKLLFVGDLVFNGRMPYMGVADFKLWIANLGKLETWDVGEVVPGHGPVGGKDILTKQRIWLEAFVADVQSWQASGQDQQKMFENVLAKHETPDRWHDMVKSAIRLVIEQYAK